MKLSPLRFLPPILLLSASAYGGEVSAPTVAKIIKIICSGTAKTKVACADAEVAAELGKLGIGLDTDAKIVWSDDEKEVTRQALAGKLVIGGRLSHIGQGAGVVIVAEGGRPTLYLGMSNIAASKLTLPDAILKLGKVVK